MADPPGDASPQSIGFIGAILAASLMAWWVVARKLFAGEPLIPFAPRRITPWRLSDAGLVLGIWFFSLVLFSSLFQSVSRSAERGEIEPLQPAPSQIQNLLLGTLASNLLAVAIGALWLRKRGAKLEIALPGKHLAADLALGARVFAVAAAPVYGLQMILTKFFPSNHPAIELLGKQGDPFTVALVVVSAAIVAPLAEEFLFRLVLQGALEGIEWRVLTARRAVDPPAFAPSDFQELDPAAEPAGPFAPYASPVSRDAIARSPDRPEQSGGDFPITALPRQFVGGLPAGVWPIVASSAFFALLHLGHGPDPIPLAVFAAILGYVYRQTHRITPSIATHLLLNSCSLVLFWLSPA